jgi:tetratricopeptide (TPR) repeat protein
MTLRMLLAALLVAAPVAAQPGRPAELVELRRMFLADQFERLDSALLSRQRDVRLAPDREQRYAYAYDAFDGADTLVRPHLDRWVAAQPRSARAWVARALHSGFMASEARGGGFASETTNSQIAAMERWLDLALEDATQALALDSAEVVAQGIRIDAYRLRGDVVEEQRAIDDALRHGPLSLAVRIRHMESLRPRWFGSRGGSEMEQFAQEAQRGSEINPRLKVLLGFPAFDRAITLEEDGQQEAALTEYGRALAYGDFHRYRYRRGRLHMRLDEYEQALADFNRAVAERPSAPYVIWRAIAYYNLSTRKTAVDEEMLTRRALEDLRWALELDPDDPDVRWVVEQRPRLVELLSSLPPAR